MGQRQTRPRLIGEGMFIENDALSRISAGSFEGKRAVVEQKAAELLGGDVSVFASFSDHSYAVVSADDSERIVKIEHSDGDDGIEVSEAELDVPVVTDEDHDIVVAKTVRGIVRSVIENDVKDDLCNQLRGLIGVVRPDTPYSFKAISEEIGKSIENGWMDLYNENKDVFRGAAKGVIRSAEARVPKTRYAKLSKGKLGEFNEELVDSCSILGKLALTLVDECSSLVFDKERDDEIDVQSVRETMVSEAKAMSGLVRGAVELAEERDLAQLAVEHDRLAERMKVMVVLKESLTRMGTTENT